MSKRITLNQQKTLPKSYTQLTVNHFFKPTTSIPPGETIKKTIDPPKQQILSKSPTKKKENTISLETDEKLIEEIEEFLKNEESCKENITPIPLPKVKNPFLPEKNENMAFQIEPTPSIVPFFEEQKSTSNSRFADLLIKDYMRVDFEEKNKILSKNENLFQITQIYNNSTSDSIPIEILHKLSNHSLTIPFKLLTMTHALFCQEMEFLLFLTGKWQILSLSSGDMIEVFGSFNEDLLLTISNDTPENFMIYEPNTILYPTLILDAHKCLRRGVLGLNYIGKDGEVSMPLVIGCLAHKVFE